MKKLRKLAGWKINGMDITSIYRFESNTARLRGRRRRKVEAGGGGKENRMQEKKQERAELCRKIRNIAVRIPVAEVP